MKALAHGLVLKQRLKVIQKCLIIVGHFDAAMIVFSHALVNKLTSVSYSSVLLLIMNFVMTLSK